MPLWTGPILHRAAEWPPRSEAQPAPVLCRISAFGRSETLAEPATRPLLAGLPDTAESAGFTDLVAIPSTGNHQFPAIIR